jgi:hypothetical protein
MKQYEESFSRKKITQPAPPKPAPKVYNSTSSYKVGSGFGGGASMTKPMQSSAPMTRVETVTTCARMSLGPEDKRSSNKGMSVGSCAMSSNSSAKKSTAKKSKTKAKTRGAFKPEADGAEFIVDDLSTVLKRGNQLDGCKLMSKD